MKKTLDKLKKTWILYKGNVIAVVKAFHFAFVAWRTHRRKLGWRKAARIAKGYFILGLAWGGFKQVKSSTT